jgi:biopolymer transport protein ExbB
MRKFIALFMLAGILFVPAFANAQDAPADSAAATEATPAAEETAASPTVVDDEIVAEEQSFHQLIKEKFIEGDPLYMTPVLLCLIIGLAIALERIITLNMATTNTKKLLLKVEEALASGGVEAAKDITRDTKGPVASIFTQGLMRYAEGIDMVEKSIVSYGSVEMGRLEKGLIWVSLFIALAPMLGFFGTVVGMIFAGGIKIALLTTVAGLIAAMILQLFYNYLVSKIDSLVNDMEDASISFVDILVKHKLTGK